MYIKNNEITIEKKSLPYGTPLLNYERFKKMPQKCYQCTTTLKNRKKYYIGEIVTFQTGFWSFKKICRQCGNSNFTGVI